MNKKTKKYILTVIILVIIVLVILGYFCYYRAIQKVEEVIKFMNYNISIEIYNDDNSDKTIKQIEKTYKKYDQLVNRNKEYKNINNLYYITYNNSKKTTLVLDKKLYDMIKYAKKWYKKSDGLIDISIGNVKNIWQMYHNSKSGYPSNFELNRAHTENIDDIVLLDKYKIKNNGINIYPDYFARGYVNEEIVNYLKNNGIKQFIINDGNNIIVGDYYKKGKYKIAINDFNNDKSYKIIEGENITISSKSIYDNYYKYDGKIYHDIINPKTLMPANNMKGITVICKDNKDCEFISTMLFLMSIEDGKKYVESNKQIEAVWYSNNNKIIKSTNFKQYE